MVGLDLETTGTDIENDRIVSAAVCHIHGREATTRTWLVDPGIEIPAEAAAIHGITTERARTEGMPARDALRALLDELDLRPADAPVVIFNARFDLTILDRERRRHGLVEPAPMLVVDPLVIDKWLDRFRKGSRKLNAICAAYGAKLDTAHDASSDALAACRAAWVLGARGTVVRNIRPWRGAQDARELAALQREWDTVRDDLGLLHEAQRVWAHDEALRLAEYFQGEGQLENAASVRSDWPLVPYPGDRTSVQ
jgi:DNA polymerase-3 subunit epsilon